MASTTHHRSIASALVMSSLGVDLEFQRLAHRAYRIEQVLAALHQRRSEHALEAVPPALDRAIHDFPGQLIQIRAYLRAAPSAADRPSASQGR